MEAEVSVALIAVAGALGGAFLGVAGSWLTTRAQLKHADRTRWHAEQRSALAALLNRSAVSIKLMDSGTADTESVGGAMTDFDRACEQAELVVPDRIRKAVIGLRANMLAAHFAYLDNVWEAERPRGSRRDGVELVESFVTAKQLAENYRDAIVKVSREHFGLVDD